MPYALVRHGRLVWSVGPKPGATSELEPKRSWRYATEAYADVEGRYALELDTWDVSEPGTLSCSERLRAGTLELTEKAPERVLPDLVLRLSPPPHGPPLGFPDIRLRPVDGVTRAALLWASARVTYYQGDNEVASSTSWTDGLGLAQIWQATDRRPPPSATFERAVVVWDVDGYLSGVEHVVELSGLTSGAIVEQPLLPDPNSLLVRGRVLRAGAPCAAADVTATSFEAHRRDEFLPAHFKQVQTAADGTFSLRVMHTRAAQLLVQAFTADHSWVSYEPAEIGGTTLECVLEVAPLAPVNVVMAGEQAGAIYAAHLTLAGPPEVDRSFVAWYDPMTRRDVAGTTTATLWLPPQRRAHVQILAGLTESGPSAPVATFEWDPAHGTKAIELQLDLALVEVEGIVGGFTTGSHTDLAVATSPVGTHPRSRSCSTKVRSDGTFSLTVEPGDHTFALLRARPDGEGCEVLTSRHYRLVAGSMNVVLELP